MATATMTPISPTELYPIKLFRRLAGLGPHAMRQARAKGLKVRYVGKNAYIKGQDFIDYVDQNATDTRNPGSAA